MPRLTNPVVRAGTLARLEQPTIAAADDLVLRPWRPDDVPAVVAAYGDPEIQRWHARSMDDGEALDWVHAWSVRWQQETGCGWAVVDGGDVLGQISFRSIDLDDGAAEISYWVLPAARGRGIAHRALAALTRWAFVVPGLHRIEVNHSVHNVGSCRVAERAGYLAEGVQRGQALHADGWHDMHHHARLATD